MFARLLYTWRGIHVKDRNSADFPIDKRQATGIQFPCHIVYWLLRESFAGAVFDLMLRFIGLTMRLCN
jgi:hypothetical protein